MPSEVRTNNHVFPAKRVFHLSGPGPCHRILNLSCRHLSLVTVSSALGIRLRHQQRFGGGKLLFRLFAQPTEKQHVGHHFGKRVALECRPRQANGADQFRLLRKQLACRCVLRVEKMARHYHHHDSARRYRINAAKKELVVDAECVQFRTVPESHALRTEWGIADCQGKGLVRQRRILEAGIDDVCARVEGRGYARGQAVQFDSGDERLAGHFPRHQADEVAHADRWLQHHSAIEAKALRGLPHEVHHVFRREVRVE